MGAGVQSSALLLMALEGELEGIRPELAVFADTQAEPKAVYEWLEYLKRTAGERVEIATVSKGNLEADTLEVAAGGGSGFATIPVYAAAPTARGTSQLRRQCTREYKIEPIYRELRARGYREVEFLLGISVDEAFRMKPARVKWVRNRWPLVDAEITRQGCIRWLREHGHPDPPRSACVWCPFHTAASWRRRREEEPEEWQRAVEFDRSIRRLPRVRGESFVHRDRVPLDEAILMPEDAGQQRLEFIDECEGMCGV